MWWYQGQGVRRWAEMVSVITFIMRQRIAWSNITGISQSEIVKNFYCIKVRYKYAAQPLLVPASRDCKDLGEVWFRFIFFILVRWISSQLCSVSKPQSHYGRFQEGLSATLQEWSKGRSTILAVTLRTHVLRVSLPVRVHPYGTENFRVSKTRRNFSEKRTSMSTGLLPRSLHSPKRQSHSYPRNRTVINFLCKDVSSNRVLPNIDTDSEWEVCRRFVMRSRPRLSLRFRGSTLGGSQIGAVFPPPYSPLLLQWRVWVEYVSNFATSQSSFD